MVAEIYDKGGISVRAVPTDAIRAANATLTDREIEQEAKRMLVEAAFGPGRQLFHRPDGSPFIEGSDRCISISHCSTLVVLATDRCGRRIGIDCETSDRGAQLARVAPKFLSPGQLTAWGTDGSSLLTAWTLKEAFYKAAGIAGLALTDIPLPPPGAWATLGGARRGIEMEWRDRQLCFLPVDFSGFEGKISLVWVENKEN